MNDTKIKKAAGLQTRLERLLNELNEKGFEQGGQVAVYLEGELIVDLCFGCVSSQSTETIKSDTIFPVCSTSKGITATLLNQLAQRGELDCESPVIRYWPEYGVHGKEKTTVRQALSHQAGIPQRPEYNSFKEICEWDLACAKIADLTPKWEPGTNAVYHSLNWGWIAGRIAEGASGYSFTELFPSRITQPLGIEKELYFGTDDDGEKRVSEFEAHPETQEQITTAKVVYKTQVPGPLMDFVNMEKVRRACMPAVNGMMSARAIAKVYAAAIGEVDGVRLFSDEALDAATTLQPPPNSLRECFGHGMGLGYVLKGPGSSPGSFFGHGGAGGSEGMVNRILKYSIGFTKNRMDTHMDAPEHTGPLVINEIMNALGHEGEGGFYQVSN